MRQFIIALALVTMTAAPSFAGSIATSATVDRNASVAASAGSLGTTASQGSVRVGGTSLGGKLGGSAGSAGPARPGK